MALLPNEIDDFVELTQPNFKRRKWTDFSLNLQRYVSAKLIQEKHLKERGGPQVDFKVQHSNTGTARNTGMYGIDVTKVKDLADNGIVPWSMQTVNWSYDIYEDIFQTDNETIVRELIMREHAAYNDMAELNEENFWSMPSSSANVERRPFGVPYWIVKNASSSIGFNGGNPTGFSGGAAGIDSNTYTNWRNYSFGYTNVTRDDLVKKVKQSIEFTNFIPPHAYPELKFSDAPCEMFSTYRVTEPLEALAESRNDNLGADLARYMGKVTIGGCPISWVPYLENNDTSDPVYGINWSYWRPYVKKGCNMRKNPPKPAAHQHTVRECHIDTWMQFICVNRRAMFVGSKS